MSDRRDLHQRSQQLAADLTRTRRRTAEIAEQVAETEDRIAEVHERLATGGGRDPGRARAIAEEARRGATRQRELAKSLAGQDESRREDAEGDGSRSAPDATTDDATTTGAGDSAPDEETT